MQAIIIKKVPTRENDQLITCYTRELGKLTTVAKSILKPSSLQAPQLDVLNLVEFELINGRATPIITAAECIRGYNGIKHSLKALACAYFFMEAVDKIVFDRQRDDRLWDFLTDVLDQLDKKPATLKMFRRLQAEAVNILGYGPGVHIAGYAAAGQSGGEMPHYDLDAVLQDKAQRPFTSLPFIYSVLE